MTYKPTHGQRDGIADRLEDWAERLSVDKKLPWHGLGLIKDLQAAADAINGVPKKSAPPEEEGVTWSEMVERMKNEKEYDL